MTQLDLLSWQPPPEPLEESQSSTPSSHTVQLASAAPSKPHTLSWHYAGLHYYRRLMLRFMALPKATTSAKQAARRHIISHLHRLSEECSDKIKLLEGN